MPQIRLQDCFYVDTVVDSMSSATGELSTASLISKLSQKLEVAQLA